MEFKDYYATLGVKRTATQDEIKRSYRKLARKYHPDLSKEPQAEDRFKEVAEAHEALIDPERRAAYDELGNRHAHGQTFEPPPGWDTGFEFSGRGGEPASGPANADFSDFFASLFGHPGRTSGERGTRPGGGPVIGGDHHAKVMIDLADAYCGAKRLMSLRMPAFNAEGRSTVQERQLEVNIPKGVRQGQHLRLAGQGAPGHGGAPPGDLYLEIALRPQAPFRVDGADVYIDLPVSPWEAALGATISAPTPDGEVQLGIPPGSPAGRKLRLKGKGLPGKTPGDLYAVLAIALPAAESPAAQVAYAALAQAFPQFDPRAAMKA